MRKKRLDLGLTQKEVAKLVGADKSRVQEWETHGTNPSPKNARRIVEFLGYVPYNVTWTVAKKLVIWRTSNGLTQAEMVRLAGIHSATLERWEEGKRIPDSKYLKQVLLTLSSITLPIEGSVVRCDHC